MFSKGSGRLNHTRGGRTAVVGVFALVAALAAPIAGTARTTLRPYRASVTPAAHIGEAVDAAVADFNRDRHLDIVEAVDGGGLAVKWGAEKGSYGDPVALDASAVAAKRVIAADVTADAVADVLAFTPGTTKLWVVPSDGHGGFLAVRTVEVPEGIRSIAVGDFDRNGGVDIAVAAQNSAAIVVLSNRNDRSGFEASSFAVTALPLSVCTVALDADARPDLVVGLTGGSVVTLRNAGAGFSPVKTSELGFDADFLATGDLDSNGWADVVAASRNGELASFVNAGATLGDPVVSRLSAPLGKIDIGFVDDDGEMDVIGYGSTIAMIFPGLGGGRFGDPHKAVEATDVRSVTLVKGSGTRQNALVLARTSGVTVETVAGPAAKLRGTLTVTNTDDIRYVCNQSTPEGPAVLETVPPAGSLRAAIVAANSSGNMTITFNLPLTQPLPPTGHYSGDDGFSSASLVWHIPIAKPLTISGNNIEILGETQDDTNPFGPDVAIQPLNDTSFRDALQDMADPFPVPTFDAFDITGSNNTISSLIISGGNFGGFPDLVVPKCSDPTTPVTITIFDSTFDTPILITGGGNVVRGCFIGTDERGIGNQGELPVGILSGGVAIVGGGGNRIGGTASEDRNIIVSGTDGVRVSQAAGNMIEGNIIGTDGTVGGRPGGQTPLNGVFVFAATDTKIKSNILGGSQRSGVLITNASTGTEITGNLIGVAGQGATNSNSDGGVVVNASDSTTIGPANIISNNSGTDVANSGGIVLTGTTPNLTTNTVIADNTISVNSANGVTVDNGDDNTIGPNNTIAQNSSAGVAVSRGTGNTITENSITMNGLLGINLVVTTDGEDGITPNDTNDADTGPNNLLNFPVFTGSTVNTTQVVVTGTAPANSTVEIFSSDEKHANGEGVTFLVDVPATSAGTFSATLPFTLPLQTRLVLTATATDSAGNTSEFGPNFTLNARINVSPTSLTFPTTAVGGTSSQTVTVCNQGVSNLNITGVAITPVDSPFTVTGLPSGGQTLAPGACLTLTVTFSPTSESNFSGTLTITSDDPDAGTITIPLGGTAVLGIITVNLTTVTISQTPIGGTRSALITVSNPTAVPVTVTRVDFQRRNSRKVTFEDRTDPFFTASPSTFTIPANGSVDVQITFSPEKPLPTPDLTSPFTLPTPAFQTPKTVKTDITFVVNDQLGLSVTVLAKAKVKPIPGLRGGDGSISGDTLTLSVNAFDPDNNITNAKFVFTNEVGVELFRIDSTPGVSKAVRRFAHGMNFPLTFTFTGVAPFADSLKFIDMVLVDADGNESNVLHFRVVGPSGKVGGTYQLVPDSGADGFVPLTPGIMLPPIEVEPRR
jgi:hypothetical protein